MQIQNNWSAANNITVIQYTHTFLINNFVSALEMCNTFSNMENPNHHPDTKLHCQLIEIVASWSLSVVIETLSKNIVSFGKLLCLLEVLKFYHLIVVGYPNRLCNHTNHLLIVWYD